MLRCGARASPKLRIAQVAARVLCSTGATTDEARLPASKACWPTDTPAGANDAACCASYGCLSGTMARARPPPASVSGVHPDGTGPTMQALVKSSPEPGLWSSAVAVPEPRGDEVVIKVQRASLCGTDLQIYNWTPWSARTVPVPLVIGHEYCGVVAALGPDVTPGLLSVGDRVTGEGHITCGTCRNCRAGRRHLCRDSQGVGVTRAGAFAEFLSLPSANVFKLPDGISDDIGSIMDPLGNAVHCALSYDLVGEDVLITGAGPIGIMAAAICKMVGARHVVVTDVNPFRLGLARECGADATVDVSRSASNGAADVLRTAAELGMTEGFDVGLEMSGKASAVDLLVQRLRHGGKIAALGIPTARVPLDLETVVFKGLIVKGIYGREIMDQWYKLSNLLQAGLQDKIAPLITHRLPADDYQRAFRVMLEGEAGKVVMNFE